jgi:hypothetical protein
VRKILEIVLAHEEAERRNEEGRRKTKDGRRMKQEKGERKHEGSRMRKKGRRERAEASVGFWPLRRRYTTRRDATSHDTT